MSQTIFFLRTFLYTFFYEDHNKSSSGDDGETKRAGTYAETRLYWHISYCCGDTWEKQPVVNCFHLPFLAEYLLLVCGKCSWRKKKNNIVSIYIVICRYITSRTYVVRTEVITLYRIKCTGVSESRPKNHILSEYVHIFLTTYPNGVPVDNFIYTLNKYFYFFFSYVYKLKTVIFINGVFKCHVYNFKLFIRLKINF